MLSRVGEGGHFGEMAIMDKGLRSADAYARADCRPSKCRERLFSLMRKDNDLAVKLLWCFVQILNRRLRTTNLDLLEARHNRAQSSHSESGRLRYDRAMMIASQCNEPGR